MSYTKTEHLYPSDEMQDYLKTDQLTRSEKILLFKLRTGMVDLKGNFSESHRGNLHCELCDDESEDETQMHLLQCNFLQKHPELGSELPKKIGLSNKGCENLEENHYSKETPAQEIEIKENF